MLKIVIPPAELWDEKNHQFLYTKEHHLTLEHSLVSLSKWESKWHKPFLSKEPKTHEETVDYIKCMTLTQNVDDSIYTYLTNKNITEINEYIEDSMTATWFGKGDDKSNKINNRPITSELIYYWMVALQIPFECQKWHLNRLITLIKVCNEENKQPKSMNKRDLYKRNAAMNAARRSKNHSKG
ncbi:MAG: hypothetical protein KBT06_03440 [Prevotellaceae bacterium]|nr:hypothetical protein [Candidatus Colivivens equi]